jgi:hypothetical protein
VYREGERLIDDDAWSAGLWTGGITLASHIVVAPPDAGALLWLLGLVITGLFGLASTALAVLLKHWLTERKAHHIAETEKAVKELKD